MQGIRNIFRYGLVVAFYLTCTLSGAALAAQERVPPDYSRLQTTRLIKDLLIRHLSRPTESFVNKKIFFLQTVEDFYERRNYEPAWSGENGFTNARGMIQAIRQSADDGLLPEHYHLGMVEDLLDRADAARKRENSLDPATLADFDLLLTDSFVTLARHLSAGCVNPLTLEPVRSLPADRDLSMLLSNALEAHSIYKTLRDLAPAEPGYAALRNALLHYRKLAGQETGRKRKDRLLSVSAGPLLKRGARSPRVAQTREILIFLGDLDRGSGEAEDFFDSPLERAVTRFQKRHGLKGDGIVGPSTIEALNVPIAERVRQLVVNLERMRWEERQRGERYLIVNIARFELDLVEQGNVVLSMKVVVGKPYLDTPVFQGKMTYLVINPVWNIPSSIAKKEILPLVKKDPSYLEKEDISILRGWGEDEKEIDPRSIDWNKVTASSLDFRFCQEPGPLNPLGRIKFMFPNTFSVYLHDTPARNLFSKNVRTFSHGCIRVEKALELAGYLLQGDPHWTRKDIEAAIENGETEEVRLPRPVSVYMVYVTSWVDKDGSVEFRQDIYKRDAKLYEAMMRNPLDGSE